jgi:hypothetical protein
VAEAARRSRIAAGLARVRARKTICFRAARPGGTFAPRGEASVGVWKAVIRKAGWPG